MKKTFSLIAIFMLSLSLAAQRVSESLSSSASPSSEVLDLSGEWSFQADPDGQLSAQSSLSDHILLPGSMLLRDKGNIPTVDTHWTGSLYDSSFFFNPYMERYRKEGNLKLPFFLTPNRHYVGDAWYRKTVMVPRSFAGRHVVLYLERPHITTTLFINGNEVGSQNSLSVAHEYDITPYVKPGKNADICIRVNNDADRVGVGADSHSVTDQTQGNWNGLAGRLELRALPSVRIAHVDVYPDVETMSVSARVMLVRDGKKAVKVNLHLMPMQKIGDVSSSYFSMLEGVVLSQDTTYVDVPAIRCTHPTDAALNFRLWDEFNPNLCTFATRLLDHKNHTLDADTLVFGFRHITTRGKDILVNGRPTMMRGTVENCCFPLTGYPPTDKESWLKVLRQCKAYGLNHLRFHSYCPPEAAFEAADELGFYLQPEGPSWPNHGIKLGNGMMIDDYLMKETQRMVERYGNHPSFAMLSCGNEPAGNWVKWVSHFVDYWRAKDPRRIYTGASVGGGWAWQPKNEYHVKAGARGLDEWQRQEPGTMTDFRSKIDTVSQPFISHETGQWCVFPDLEEVSQYTGPYKARNFEIFSDILKENGMQGRARQFLMSSGKLQALCYKYELEKTLRTPHYAGFQLLGLNDYSGQGTALVGPLNVFWKEKGYVDSLQWRESCNPVTVLARMPRFTYYSGDTIHYDVELLNYGRGDIVDMKARALFLDEDSNVVSENLFGGGDVPVGALAELGHYVQHFATDVPRQLTLKIEAWGKVDGESILVSNHWPVWVYPRHSQAELDKLVASSPNPVYVCNGDLDEQATSVLQKGGRVLILAGPKLTYGADIAQNYTPVFWNTSWFKMRPPHTTGVYVDNQHPLFSQFPTDDFSDLQWWALTNRQKPILMDQFPKDFQPIVQPIDTWFLSRKLGMLFEANVMGGQVLVTTLPLDIASRYPAVSQLTYAIYHYLTSTEFHPTTALDANLIHTLFTQPTPKVDMFTKDSPDELKKGVK